MSKVKARTKLMPGDLRAYMARHRVSAPEVGRRRGVGASAILKAVNSDDYGRTATQDLLYGILDAINDLLLEREGTACLSQ